MVAVEEEGKDSGRHSRTLTGQVGGTPEVTHVASCRPTEKPSSSQESLCARSTIAFKDIGVVSKSCRHLAPCRLLSYQSETKRERKREISGERKRERETEVNARSGIFVEGC